MFTLPDTKTETDKKWLVHNCGGVLAAQRQKLMQFSIGFCNTLSVSVPVSGSGSVNEP